jgi:hypothetical protein
MGSCILSKSCTIELYLQLLWLHNKNGRIKFGVILKKFYSCLISLSFQLSALIVLIFLVRQSLSATCSENSFKEFE